MEYKNYKDEEKKALLEKLYSQGSIREVAKELNLTTSFIYNEFKRLGVVRLTRQDSMKKALKTGRLKHPTEGKTLSAETKEKIGDSISKHWDSYSPEEYDALMKTYKEAWKKKPAHEKQELQEAAHAALLKTTREGSKLEKIVADALTEAGFYVELHRSAVLANEKLELDIFVPKLKTIIEIDGPTHFRPIFGEERLKKVQRADAEKNGLLLREGYIVIRMQQYKKKYLSKTLISFFSAEIVKQMKKIEENAPTELKDRFIVIQEPI